MSADPEEREMASERNRISWERRLATEPHLSSAKMRRRLQRLGAKEDPPCTDAWLDLVMLLTRKAT